MYSYRGTAAIDEGESLEKQALRSTYTNSRINNPTDNERCRVVDEGLEMVRHVVSEFRNRHSSDTNNAMTI